VVSACLAIEGAEDADGHALIVAVAPGAKLVSDQGHGVGWRQRLEAPSADGGALGGLPKQGVRLVFGSAAKPAAFVSGVADGFAGFAAGVFFVEIY
jgi:hypothetical protein